MQICSYMLQLKGTQNKGIRNEVRVHIWVCKAYEMLVKFIYKITNFYVYLACPAQVGIGGDQVPSDQLVGRPSDQQHHAGGQEQQQPHRPVLTTTRAMPATAFLISRPSNPVSAIVPPVMQQASVVLDHDQFHVPAILLHHHEKFQVIKIIYFSLLFSSTCLLERTNYIAR
jgi:hypothetical protein